MNRFNVLFTAVCILLSASVKAQVGVGTSTPHTSAQLEVSSTNKGLLIPRVTQANRPSSPAIGLLIYQTDGIAGFYYYNGSSWQYLGMTYTLQQNLNTNGFSLSSDGTNKGITLGNNGIIVSKGDFGGGDDITESGSGTKIIWYPKRAAFRAGRVSGDQWDVANLSYNSFAAGFNTIASGSASVALGSTDTASGSYAVAMGSQSKSTGQGTIAMGLQALATGAWGSVALGYGTTSSGYYASTSLGYYTVASGNYTLASGYQTTASGNVAFAGGYQTTASGDYSTALGSWVSTNGQTGSFIIGDRSNNTILNNDATNQMMMRFAGGYKLYSHYAGTIGVQLNPSANSWSTISDENKKENFASVNGEDFLQKIARFNLTSWNYKGQDPKKFRHYGPMAQEFFEAFGRDEYGVIGDDTTISQADFDGINLIAIHALEKRTTELKKENEQLQQQVAKTASYIEENETLKQKVARLEQQVAEQQKEMALRIQKLEMLVNTTTGNSSVTAK